MPFAIGFRRTLLTASLLLLATSVLVLPARAADDGSSLAAEVTGRETARGKPYVPVYHPEMTIRPAAGPITIDLESLAVLNNVDQNHTFAKGDLVKRVVGGKLPGTVHR